MDILKNFTEIIQNNKLIQPGDQIIVSVSGGVDSVTLLDLLMHLKKNYDLTLHVFHVHHGLRGAEADRDQTFVRRLAEIYELDHSDIRVDVIAYSSKTGSSIEEAARSLRYRSLLDLFNRLNYNSIALGHNADDQAETIIDHFLRGSGIRGLAGMEIIREPFIRPLLAFRRDEIETYASQKGLHYVTDSSNSDINFRRNRIRHKLLPLLQQEFNPAIANTLTKIGSIFRDYDRYFKFQAKQAFESCCKSIKKNKIILDIEQFFSYFNAIQVYILYYVLSVAHIDENVLTFSKLKTFSNLLANRKPGTRLPVYENWEFLIDHDGLIFHRPETGSIKFPIEINREYPLYDSEQIFRCELITRDQLPVSFPKNKNIEFVDYDRIKGGLTIRNALPGDRFIPLNFTGRKKLSNFYTDEKVPLHIRNQVPLLTTHENIIWIIGYRIDDRFKVTENSRNILKLEVRGATNEREIV
ncbi:tRNA lysidine(34) synthetase TilS [candidate division KSB1 bacterium]|nr:tRNA lysidine(34) synthetase TilS [candidate division KSB1 bacterium]